MGLVLVILGIVFAVVGLCAILLRRGRRYDDATSEKVRPRIFQPLPKPLSDDDVAMVQLAFEQRLDNDAELPDAIVWRDAYIYRQLMSEWFGTLIERHRNDGKLANKLREDWLDYLSWLETYKTEACLSGESRDEEKRDQYEHDASRSRRIKIAIEDAFAAAVGEDATETLLRVRAADHDVFDRSGKKPLAPKGYRYFPVSFRPYREELKRKTF